MDGPLNNAPEMSHSMEPLFWEAANHRMDSWRWFQYEPECIVAHIYIYLLVGGWAYPSEKYDSVSWDDDIP